ncbi:Peptide chain release factor 2; programmed frameshift-containing [Bathymodiolus heckerae thiotrophic gill symbiont]|uniref:peptide chain release factor 2 n=1 Tax=Bathymodiolus heckerae thiotrophic gill symbiont TaxID=1052212 RepID=UPI0010B6D249|nr:peptide chain release factor 2 [Bathymodiolus heckerae thiotrophic gill symbiont]SHN89880.1 Peptide chain release factor 2; programmed frameshift-containing [Bathymodiolus heckerae thiotrophic gill symbiont]
MELSPTYQHIDDLIERAKILSVHLDLEEKQGRLEEVLLEMENPDVWSKPEVAQSLSQEKSSLETICHTFEQANNILNDAVELLDMAQSEDDEDCANGVKEDLNTVEKSIAKLEFERMFNGNLDANSAYLDIQSGSGGTEAQDWAEMVLRMYLRWGDKHKFKVTLMEASAGEVAGIKSATVHLQGEYAYGWLRSEIGIHRLVRKSPFNANGKRHTSFCSVFVSPEVDDDIDIEINKSDIRIDTYRASGAGGQHVNKTDSAVRITHLPTNTVVQCQDGRSQHANKDQAMKQLKSKLYELEMQKRNNESQEQEDAKSDIGWGHQIRSYVLDQSRIKDLRTGVESTNTGDVLDGNLDKFIEASLKAGY